jgi:hypothetical protein
MGWGELRQAGGPVQALLGCAWGRTVSTPDDTERCPRRAVQIVVLHNGDASLDLKLCNQHVTRLSRETTPRESGPA